MRSAYTVHYTNPEGVTCTDSSVNGAPWSRAMALMQAQRRNVNASYRSTGRPHSGEDISAESRTLSRNFVRQIQQDRVFQEEKKTKEKLKEHSVHI